MQRLLAAAVLIGATFGLQWFTTRHTAEFSLYPDESAHYVTGLMFTEYIRQGFPGSPIHFAEQFYIHYPKVAIGSWPPAFYSVQALWELPLGSSKASAYSLIAAIMAAITVWIFLLSRGMLGTPGALLLGVVFLLLPITQYLLQMMMADGLVALLTLAATVLFARYWEMGRYRDAVLYGMFVGATVLVKGSGVALTLIPVFAIILTRRWNMVLAKPLWLAAAVVAIIGGPWTAYTLKIVQDGFQESIPLSSYVPAALLRLPWWHALNLTIPVAGVFCLGVWRMSRRPAGANSPLLLSTAATVLAVLVFHLFVTVGMEPRRIFMAIPQSLLIVAQGIHWLREGLPNRPVWQLAPSLALVLIAGFHSLPPVRKPHYGFDRAAQYIHSKPEWAGCVTLVSSEIDGEGMLISEMAVRENIPRRYFLRASKALSSSSWNATDYKLKIQSVDEMVRFLEQSPVKLIVRDTYPNPRIHYPHHDLLAGALAGSPQWEKVASFSGSATDGAISLYRHRTKGVRSES